jgi:hypothetical protein
MKEYMTITQTIEYITGDRPITKLLSPDGDGWELHSVHVSDVLQKKHTPPHSYHHIHTVWIRYIVKKDVHMGPNHE